MPFDDGKCPICASTQLRIWFAKKCQPTSQFDSHPLFGVSFEFFNFSFDRSF